MGLFDEIVDSMKIRSWGQLLEGRNSHRRHKCLKTQRKYFISHELDDKHDDINDRKTLIESMNWMAI